MEGWVSSSSRAPVKCLRSSMQNMGGVSGFSRGTRVSWALGWAGLAESNRRTLSRPARIWSTASSRAGW